MRLYAELLLPPAALLAAVVIGAVTLAATPGTATAAETTTTAAAATAAAGDAAAAEEGTTPDTAAATASANAHLEPAPEGLDGHEVARRAENNMRSDRTYFEGRMIVSSPRLAGPREVAFRSWEDRPEKRSFIRILSPAKDAGTGFLKLHPNLWMYIPRVERTMRIPPSMMLQSWMGSDFSNDDLVRESSELDDYDHRLLGVDTAYQGEGGPRAYVVEYLPHPDAPVVWGRILAWIAVDHATPLRQDFYDEEGEKLRVLRFEQIHEVDGRWVPYRWTLTPLDKPGHRTVIEVKRIEFDAKFSDDIFTTRNLKRGR